MVLPDTVGYRRSVPWAEGVKRVARLRLLPVVRVPPSTELRVG